MPIKSFSVSDTLLIEANTGSVDLPVRHLVIRFGRDRPFDVVYLDEAKELIVQLVEATIYLCSPEDTSSH